MQDDKAVLSLTTKELAYDVHDQVITLNLSGGIFHESNINDIQITGEATAKKW